MTEREFAGLRCSEVLEQAGAYVVGALPGDEAAAVRDHVAACPESHAEIRELGAVVPALFEAVEQVEPPPALKQRILAAAAAEQAASASSARLQAPRSIDTGREAQPVPGPGWRRWDLGELFRRPIWAGVAAAAVVAAVALGALSLQLRGEVDGLTAYRNGVVEVLDQAARPGAQLAVLAAPEGAPGPTGLAAVGADGRVAMVMRDLAPTTGSQVYEAWLIGPDGTPIPVGGFEVDSSRTASFTSAPAAVAGGVTVALTLEPGPGATTPTLPIVSLGTARGDSS